MKKIYQRPEFTIYMIKPGHLLNDSPANRVGMSTEEVAEEETIYSRRISCWDEEEEETDF